MALNTQRWTRMPHGMVQGFEALAAPSSEVDDATKEFVAQIMGDNFDLFFRYAQTGGHLTYLEYTNGCLPFPVEGEPYPPAIPSI